MRLSIGITFFFVAAACAGMANAQSFNCRRAYFADEKLICTRPELAQLDNQLASVFGRAIGRLSPSERTALENGETQWAIGRRKCHSDFACIAQHYRSRIEQLSPPASRRASEQAPPTAAGATPAARETSEPQPAPPKARTPVRAATPSHRPVDRARTATATIRPDASAKAAVGSSSQPQSPATTPSGPAIHWANPPPER